MLKQNLQLQRDRNTPTRIDKTKTIKNLPLQKDKEEKGKEEKRGSKLFSPLPESNKDS